ncbi:MAG: glutathione peroxidase [Flavobacteriales bacterium]
MQFTTFPLAVASFLFISCFNSVQVAPAPAQNATSPMATFHTLSANDINGNPVQMSQFAGKKVLVVNTASECGYTPQYKQLQELYEAYKDKGLVVIGFPCNDFGGQEPGTAQEIEQFCQKNYGVTFPLMEKVRIKGNDPSPVYKWLTRKAENGVLDADVKWNFHKFLINEQGHLVKVLGSGIEPGDEEIVSWLNG